MELDERKQKMVSDHEYSIRRSVYVLSVPEFIRHYISGDNGGFTLVFRTFPQKSRDNISERNSEIFCRYSAARDIHSDDGQRIFPFFQQCRDYTSVYDGNGASVI